MSNEDQTRMVSSTESQNLTNILTELFGYGFILTVGLLIVAYGLPLFMGYISGTVLIYGTLGTPILLFALIGIGVFVALVGFMGALKTTLESLSFG